MKTEMFQHPRGCRRCHCLSILLWLPCLSWLSAQESELSPVADPIPSWRRHIIDDSSRGADGTRLADANGDGLLDIVTGWEEGGVTRLYLNPGPENAKQRWPAVTVGPAKNVEDAVMVDLDRDGAMDVISCCEGNRKAMLVHWGPDPARILDEDAWRTEVIPDSLGRCRWMYAEPGDLDGDGRVEVMAGGKGDGSQIGWWQLPDDARDLQSWTWHPLLPVGWLMSLDAVDMNGDGRVDLVYSDRKGALAGCFWLEHPGNDLVKEAAAWKKHEIGALGREVMFLKRGDIDGDGLEDVALAIRPHDLALFHRLDSNGHQWRATSIRIPDRYGQSKAIAVADLNRDKKNEIVFSTGLATDGRIGVGFFQDASFEPSKKATSTETADVSDKSSWKVRAIGDGVGVKHDIVEVMDLDGDGDLDVLTCEERTNLGVIWFENPEIDANAR